jgi:23S rRNA (uracil1939-C5)-methyltransferase
MKQKDLYIDSVAFGGKGIARSEGKVYFVDDTVPGDQVDVEVYDDQTRYASARVIHWSQRSPIRGPSGCDYSDHCGGCQWQEIKADDQLTWKKSFLESSIKRIGRLKGESITEESLEVRAADTGTQITASSQQQEYRNRVLFRVRVTKEGFFQAGYFKRGSREFVHVTRCSIADPTINRFIRELSQLDWKSLGSSSELRFRFEVQVIPTSDRESLESKKSVVVSVYDPEGDPSVDGLKISRLIASNETVQWCGQVSKLADAPFLFFENDLGINFFTSPGLFQQVNLPMNRVLRRKVISFTQALVPKAGRILDLCCGSGNLSLPLTKLGYSVVGVEFSKKSIECAKHNQTQNSILNAEYIAGDAEKFLLKACRDKDSYDVVILDPPRQGMYKAMTHLASLNPKVIIYVSCDPTTLARDVGALAKHGYRLKSLEAMDFFPNTYHVESLAVLEK